MTKRKGRKNRKIENVQALRDLQNVSWSPSTKTRSFEASVKSQFNTAKNPNKNSFDRPDTVEESAKKIDNEFIRKDIRKSLILVSLVLALEIMLYLIWNKYW